MQPSNTGACYLQKFIDEVIVRERESKTTSCIAHFLKCEILYLLKIAKDTSKRHVCNSSPPLFQGKYVNHCTKEPLDWLTEYLD